MGALLEIQHIIMWGVIGYVAWKWNEVGVDALCSKFSDRLALFYLFSGIPVSTVMHFLLTILPDGQSFYQKDSQGFSWLNGELLLICNLISLGIAYYVASKYRPT